jgi:hypothetical protein
MPRSAIPNSLSPSLLTLVALSLWPSLLFAERFSEDPYLLDFSVAGNGSAEALPGSPSPSRFLEWPSDLEDAPRFSLEAATLPILGGLSEMVNGGFSLRVAPQTQLQSYAAIVTTSDIPVRPLLQGSYEDRLERPEWRADYCPGCGTLRDRVYLGFLNLAREWITELPRTGLESRPIPLSVDMGVKAKTFWEELEGGDYQARNLNLDAGVGVTLDWDHNPITGKSGRQFRWSLSAHEILGTPQRSEMEGEVVEEALRRRWRMAIRWKESFPGLRSEGTLGLRQLPEAGKWPSLGGAWKYRNFLETRAGFNADVWAAGFSLHHNWLALHYAFQVHDLGIAAYQVSLEFHRL